MRKLFVTFAALICICASAPAYADTASAEWLKYEAQIQSLIVQKISVIEKTREYRENSCAKLTETKDACLSWYDLIIARRLLEKATLENYIAPISMSDKERTSPFVMKSTEYDAYNIVSNNMAQIAVSLFPQPKKAVAK